MNFVHFSGAVFQQVLAATISGSVLALLILMIQRALGRKLGPAWRHALWLLVLARVLIPVLPESRFSIFNAPNWIKPPAPAAAPVTVTILPTPPTTREPIPIESSIPEGDISFPDSEPLPGPKTPLTTWEILGLVWLSASIALLLRLIIGSCWLRMRLRRHQVSFDPAIVRLLAQARSRLRTLWNPRAVETSCVDSPGLFGALRPRILLPPGIATQLSDTELRHVFLHEIAHLKRGDLWVNVLMSIVHLLHWFNPLVWFVLRRMRLERELACDALVLRTTEESETHSYGETILKLLETLRSPVTLGPVVGILEEKSAAASRLKQITEFRSRRPASSALGFGLLIALAVIGLSNAQTEKRETPNRKQAAVPELRVARDDAKSPTPAAEGLDELTAEYRNQRKLVENLEKQLEDLRGQLGIKDTEFYPSDLDTLRNIERDYTQARSRVADYSKISSDLKTKSRAELRKVLPTAAPDAAMDRYLGDLAKVEQQYAANIGDLGPQHPEIQKLKELTKVINQQIEDRIDGVLAGVELQIGQAQAVVAELEKRLATARAQADIRKLKEYKEYSRVKDSLENERRIRDVLYQRLEAEKLESKVLPEKTDPLEAGTLRSVDGSVAVKDARVLLEMGKLDEAEAKLKEVVKDDPQNREAFYYLKLIKERRFNEESRRRAAAGPIFATGGPLAPDPSRLFPASTNRPANPFAFMTNRVYTSAGRGRILVKLENIILPEFRLSKGDVMSEIIKNLHRQVIAHDPDKTGINFVLSNPADSGFGLAPAIDPRTGREPIRVEDFETKSDVVLSNVSLKMILQTLIEALRPPDGFDGADPVVYSIEDYAVVFQQRRAENQALYTRTYKLNANTLVEGLDGIYVSPKTFPDPFSTAVKPRNNVYLGNAGEDTAGPERGGIIGMTDSTNIINKLRKFFIAAGVNFEVDPTSVRPGAAASPPPQKAIFYNDKTGILMVRATLADLDKIENALQALNVSPPQIMIETQIIEFTAGAAYREDLLLRVAATNQLMADPQLKALTEALGNTENGRAGISVFTGILGEMQFHRVFKGLKDAEGVNVLSSPKVTTLSGRAARISVNPGPSVGVFATVQADGRTIHLATDVEIPSDKQRKLAEINASTEARVLDGQTLVFRPIQKERNIVVFLTPTIIDPAGNRVHSPPPISEEASSETGK
jgi:beta-lactamase regulating signal transducer with metallopeptidase domain